MAGLWRLDGALADAEVLSRMAGAMAWRGPDGVRLRAEGNLGMAFLALNSTPEDVRERQPLAGESGNWLAFHGRLDNREELASALGLPREETDAAIALRAREAWGRDCPNRLIGPFALAFFDKGERSLFCARDFLGLRPLFYFFDGKTFAWASEPRALLEVPGATREVNEGAVGEHLCDRWGTTEGETFFRDVQRLPRGHFLTINAAGMLRLGAWLDFDHDREHAFASDAEAAEAFREVFQEAVRCRTRSVGPLGAHLSGGLDSSSVVGVAEGLRRDGRASCGELIACSAAYPGVPGCDEIEFAQAVAEKLGIALAELPHQPAPLSAFEEQAAALLDLPDAPNGFGTHPTFPFLRERGARACLTGLWGDHWLSGTRGRLRDLLRSGRFREAWALARLDAPGASVRGAAGLLWRDGGSPLLRGSVPESVRQALRAAKRTASPERYSLAKPWISNDFAKRIDLGDRLRQRPLLWRPFASHARAEVFREAISPMGLRVAESAERFSAWHGIDARHPFADRRVFEFCLALPERSRRRGNWEKIVLRKAMEGLLPEEVRLRQGKAEFSHLLRGTLGQAGEKAFANPSAAGRGWLKHREARALWAEGTRGEPEALWALWKILGVEIWLTATADHR